MFAFRDNDFVSKFFPLVGGFIIIICAFNSQNARASIFIRVTRKLPLTNPTRPKAVILSVGLMFVIFHNFAFQEGV